jgi:hypothetical protein
MSILKISIIYGIIWKLINGSILLMTCLRIEFAKEVNILNKQINSMSRTEITNSFAVHFCDLDETESGFVEYCDMYLVAVLYKQ